MQGVELTGTAAEAAVRTAGAVRRRDVAGVRGLSLLTGATDAELARAILEGLETERWKRWRHYRPFERQDFGYDYEISSREVHETTPMPEEIRALFPALRAAGWTGPDPTQCIVTRYPEGGSLGPHIDAEAFGPVIGGVSLCNEWPIVFSRGRAGTEERIPLPTLSAYVMQGPARTSWTHRIPRTERRGRRTSLTFRTVLEEAARRAAGAKRVTATPRGRAAAPAGQRRLFRLER